MKMVYHLLSTHTEYRFDILLLCKFNTMSILHTAQFKLQINDKLY